MPLAVVKTNLAGKKIPADFNESFEDFIVRVVGCMPSLTMVELHTDLVMSREGTRQPMVNMEFHHNEPEIHSLTKKDYAAKFAKFLVDHLHVPVERVLILFFDTTCTTVESTAL